MTLAEATKLTEEGARTYLEGIRWPEGPVCPHCGELDNAVRMNGAAHRAALLQCRGCRKQFSVTVGTIMERSHITPRQWVIAFHMMCASKKGVSALQLQRMLGLGSYKSAWHMAHRIRLAMREEPLRSLLGQVEADETYVGGKPRNKKKRDRWFGGKPKLGRGTDRTPVLALIERGGRARAFPLDTVKAADLRKAIDAHVDKGSTLNTDEFPAYKAIGREFEGGHRTVTHSKGQYAKPDGSHVNNCESFFGLFKRGVHGAFHHVSKQHLHRYLDEFSFRWDHRKTTDGERTAKAIKAAEGKRLTYQTPAEK